MNLDRDKAGAKRSPKRRCWDKKSPLFWVEKKAKETCGQVVNETSTGANLAKYPRAKIPQEYLKKQYHQRFFCISHIDITHKDL